MVEIVRNAPQSNLNAEVIEPDRPFTPASTSNDLLNRLQTRWEDLKQRISEPNAENRPSLTEELRADADYVRLRARYYHENRPLHALGIVAAGAFAVGLVIGFWRR